VVCGCGVKCIAEAEGSIFFFLELYIIEWNVVLSRTALTAGHLPLLPSSRGTVYEQAAVRH
jgi:hypothetical protein